MRILNIRLGERTYKSGKISLFLTKEALKVQREALGVAKKAEGMEMKDIDSALEILDELEDISNKKVWLLCEAYENKFTADEMEKALDAEEIDAALNQLIGRTSQVIEKN